jgi:hypothetical protein
MGKKLTIVDTNIKGIGIHALAKAVLPFASKSKYSPQLESIAACPHVTGVTKEAAADVKEKLCYLCNSFR